MLNIERSLKGFTFEILSLKGVTFEILSLKGVTFVDLGNLHIWKEAFYRGLIFSKAKNRKKSIFGELRIQRDSIWSVFIPSKNILITPVQTFPII